MVLAAGLGLTGHAQAADPSGDVFVPGFWDLQAPRDKPVLDAATTIRFVTADDYPPFGFTLPNGTLTGFNVDLAHALCEALKVTCTIQARPWSGLEQAVVDNEADAAVASLAITAEARRRVGFTSPYYRTPARFLARTAASAEPVSPEALKGKSVAVQAGTAQEAYLRTFFPDAVGKPFPTAVAARRALKAGTVDLVFDDGIGAAVWLNGDEAGGCCAFRGGAYTESRFFGEGAGIAVRKADATLRRALDAALAQVAASGRYGDLYLKYFPVGFY